MLNVLEEFNKDWVIWEIAGFILIATLLSHIWFHRQSSAVIFYKRAIENI